MSDTPKSEHITFDPEAIAVMVRAFGECWTTVSQSSAVLDEQAARDLLARFIVAAALDGERDPARLSQSALQHLAQATGMQFVAPAS